MSAPTPCGPAAIASVLAIFGIPFEESDLLALVASDGSMSMAEVSERLSQSGLVVRQSLLDVEGLSRVDSVCVLYILDDRAVAHELKSGHFLVSISASGGEMTLLEPTTGEVIGAEHAASILRDRWTGDALAIHGRAGVSAPLVIASLVSAAVSFLLVRAVLTRSR
jgi:ABC-type bacteriocin/lantibiotic exporter with double-glycine peptidase domain